ncbi:MAG TPA: dienelactone hydrolase family protein [Roseateles sp.]
MVKEEAGRFAAAVQPVTAQTVTTDTVGLKAGPVCIPVDDFEMSAYRAQPAGGNNLPVILVASEIFGVHEHIADVCRRFAKLGYLAIAPELFVRHGDAGAYTETARLIAEVVNKAGDAQVMADLDATVAWAADHGGDTARLGITGFCWGGRMTWRYVAHNPRVKAGVAWYGPVARSYHPGDKTIVELAAGIKAPVLGLYGAADGGIPVDTLTQLEAALRAAGNLKSEFVVYPDTPHAFHADYRPSYRKAAADDGWAKCVAWFRENGVA